MNNTNRFSSLDYLRLLAASAVMYSHSYVLAGAAEQEPYVYVFCKIDAASLAVNFFFFLSGYLMFGALPRSESRIKFLTNRFARIVPGLAVCVGLTIVFGFFLTTRSKQDYLTSLQTFSYLKNIAFLFTPSIPGVFESQPYPSVINGSLWTLFYEVACYCLLSLIQYLNQRAKVIILCIITGLCLIYLGSVEYKGPTFLGNISRLTVLFCTGYLFCSVFKAKSFFYSMALALLVFNYMLDQYIQPIAGCLVATVLIYAALLDIVLRTDCYFKHLPFDCSFGAYIYAFPIQQWLISLNFKIVPLQLFIYSLCIVLPIAIVSWIFVEKPAMARIRNFSKTNFFRSI